MNTRRLIVHVSVVLFFLLVTSMTIAQTVPTLIYFSGSLTDDTGSPLPDGNYAMEFNFYAAATGGSPLLTDSHSSVQVSGGLYSVQLGSGTLTSGGVYNDLGELFRGASTIWLGITLPSDDEMSPRIQFLSSSYAIQAENSSKVDGHDYDPSWPTTLTTIQNAASGDFHTIGGQDDDQPDTDAEVPDAISINNSRLYAPAGSGNVGIGTTSPNGTLTVNGSFVRSGSTVNGTNATTHINLGVTSTTGTDGQNFSYATVSGGQSNVAAANWSTVGGGFSNQATAERATVAGGQANVASGLFSTISGGFQSTAVGNYATVAGGYRNAASADYSTVVGGSLNEAIGQYSFAGGRRAKANHDGSFVWADSSDADFFTTAEDQFLIRAQSGVGINAPPSGETLYIQGDSVRLYNPEGEYGSLGKFNFGDGQYVYLQEDQDDMLTIHSSRLALTGGNVGIGMTTPGQKLTVAGTIESTLGGVKFPDGTTQATAATVIPSGVIVMWSGTTATIPAGWALCDGSNGTPNLLDRFILSVGNSENPGGIGGSNTHYHTVPGQAVRSGNMEDNRPEDTIPNINSGYHNETGASFPTLSALYNPYHGHDVSISGVDSWSASNVPAYYKLAFIMKL